jgi:hypothetical protein
MTIASSSVASNVFFFLRALSISRAPFCYVVVSASCACFFLFFFFVSLSSACFPARCSTHAVGPSMCFIRCLHLNVPVYVFGCLSLSASVSVSESVWHLLDSCLDLVSCCRRLSPAPLRSLSFLSAPLSPAPLVSLFLCPACCGPVVCGVHLYVRLGMRRAVVQGRRGPRGLREPRVALAPRERNVASCRRASRADRPPTSLGLLYSLMPEGR